MAIKGKEYYWSAKRENGELEAGYEPSLEECEKYKYDTDIFFNSGENFDPQPPEDITFPKFKEKEIIETLKALEEKIDEGDIWYYQKIFLHGVITRKDFLIDSFNYIKNKYLRVKHFRYIYALYEIAYIQDGIFLSDKEFRQRLAETNKIPVDWKGTVEVCYEMVLHCRRVITDDEFKSAIKYLIQEEKYRMFDKEILNAVKSRKEGDIEKAEETLTKYLHNFMNVTDKGKPISLAKRSKFAIDKYLRPNNYSYETFSARLNDLTGGGWRGETWIIGGYCLKEGTLILNGNGSYVPIEEFVKKKMPYVISMKDDYKLSKQKVSSWLDTGLLDTYNVKTNIGNEISVSMNHPFYTLNGWKKIKDLKIGDYIAIPRKLPMPIKKKLKTEGDIMWDRITSIKHEGKNQCYDLSIPKYNNFIANDFVVHNTSDGKTQLSKELAYNAILNGDNVLVVTLEMDDEEMEHIFQARIAYDMGFSNLTLNRIRRRQLDAVEFEDYKKVVEKMGSYRNLYIQQPEGKFSMDILDMEIDKIQSHTKLDILIIDYLELVDPDKNYESYRVRIKEIMRRAKILATQKNLWVIVPHQISRMGREKAEKRSDPYYIMSDLQESSGVEQNCVVMLWIYQDDYYRSRNRAKIGVAKNRMGRLDLYGWEIGTDWEHCRLYDDGLRLAKDFTVEKKEDFYK